MATKEYFLKEEGRQAYHFVISLAPGEGDPLTMFNIAKDFCDRYLGNEYEHIYAVHTDREHIHAHIVFNSVSCTDGRKYHYKKGDFDKWVRPVTDASVVKNGLKPLEYDREDPEEYIHYGEWLDSKNGNFRVRIREDIDQAIKESDSFDELIRILEMKYQIRFGYSEKWRAEYFSLYSPEMGMKKARRNYTLGNAYTVDNLKERIRLRHRPEMYLFAGLVFRIEIISQRQVSPRRQYSRRQKRYLSYHWRLRRTQRRLAGDRETKQEFRQADHLLEEISFLEKHHLTFQDLPDAEKSLQLQLDLLRTEEREDREALPEDIRENTAELMTKRRRERQQRCRDIYKTLSMIREIDRRHSEGMSI
ncbi:MAG: relaxase/mobilization nuclease domain-containing protein, partial [Lachnospiraceae bacterium]|nr:relaxase/mobilization nuclease domain-containing protein [Lachnospiraceae bacterium]